MKYLVFLLLNSVIFFCYANNNVVNIFNWSGYMPNKVINEFTQQTGIKVNTSTFGSNEELFAKLAASGNNSGYDIVVPSANYVTRMQDLGMLQKIDHSKLTNLKNINPSLLNQAFDKHNQYSLPYLWGITAILINRQFLPHIKIERWQDLWKPELKNQLLMLDGATEPFEIAMRTLGYQPNNQNPQYIKAAYQMLIKLLPNIKLFNITAPSTIMANNNANIAVVYNGDAWQAIKANPHLHFIYPKDGAFVWIDNITIPKNAPHLANAYKFINFVMRPKIAAQISEYSGYSSPNIAALKYLPKATRESQVLYPSKRILDKASFEKDTGKAYGLYQHYWFLLKLKASE